jgi:GntR family transcriptional regulator of arabinose operon
MFTISPTTENRSETIINHLRDRLISGDFAPGDSFYSRNELTVEFSVSPVTADKIIAALVHEGYLHRMRGKGTFVNADINQIIREKEQLLGNNLLGIAGYFQEQNLENPESRTPQILAGFENESSQNNFAMKLLNIAPKKKIDKGFIKKIIDSKVKGILYLPGSAEEAVSSAEKLTEAKIPFVLADHACAECDYVKFDDLWLGEAGAKHLLKIGHKNIMFVGMDTPYRWNKLRAQGFQEALEKSGFNSKDGNDLVFLTKKPNGKIVAKEIKDFLLKIKGKVTGLLCTNDSMACDIIEVAESLDINIPDDLSLIGIDDLFTSRAKSITTFQASGFDIGKAAADTLFKRIRENPKGHIQIELKTPLIRRSTDKIL